MGLELPLALLGLLAGVLPWLAHRIRRRDMPVVALPTLSFLKQAEAAQRRRRNLSDLLLLAARIGLFIALCMALTAPYVTARVTFGDGEVSSAVIVIDDSMSMQREYDGSSLLTRAVDRAADAIGALPRGSEVAVVLAGRPARVWLERTDDLEAAIARVRELPPRSHRGTDLAGALTLSRRKLATSDKKRRRMLVLSDFAVHARFDPAEDRDGGIEAVYERLAPAPAIGNAHIDSVSAAPDPTQPGRWTLAVTVQAYGEVPAQVPLRVEGAGETSERQMVAMRDGRGRVLASIAQPARGADPRIRLSLELDDALPEDNQRDLLVGEQAAVRVLLVNGDPHPANDRDELHYVARALSLAPADALRTHLRSVDAAMLEHHDLSRADVVVMANVPAPSEPYVARLSEFVRRGGGVVVTGGDHVDPQRYNAVLEELLGVHLSASEKVGSLGFAEPEDSSFLPHGLAGLHNARVTRRLRSDGPAEVRLSYADGVPALFIHRVGRGRVLLFTSTLDADWTDLPLRPGFLALATGLVRAAAGERADLRTPRAPGEPALLPVAPGATLMEIVSPDDVRHRFDGLEGPLLTFADTELSGAYRVTVASGQGGARFAPELSFVVPPPDDEADLREGDALRGLAAGRAGAAGSASSAQVRKPLARFLLLLAAVFGVLETGLRSLRLRRPRG